MMRGRRRPSLPAVAASILGSATSKLAPMIGVVGVVRPY